MLSFQTWAAVLVWPLGVLMAVAPAGAQDGLDHRSLSIEPSASLSGARRVMRREVVAETSSRVGASWGPTSGFSPEATDSDIPPETPDRDGAMPGATPAPSFHKSRHRHQRHASNKKTPAPRRFHRVINKQDFPEANRRRHLIVERDMLSDKARAKARAKSRKGELKARRVKKARAEAKKERKKKKSRRRMSDSPCVASMCPLGKVLKRHAERPHKCTDPKGCSASECCVGTCDGFSCPKHTNLVSTKGDSSAAAMCSGFTCNQDECCLGTCSMITCPLHSAKADRHVNSSPNKCNSFICANAECCQGTCSGVECPAGSVKMSAEDQPKMCDKFPCEVESCCVAVCTEALCTKHGHGKLLSLSARNATKPKQCKKLPCEPKECCAGSCGDGTGVCTAKQPPLVSSAMPSVCGDWECDRDECCVGRCSSDICTAGGTFLMATPKRCGGNPCKDSECCVGRCTDAMCGTVGLMLRTDAPTNCVGVGCTEKECCTGICSESTCPTEKGLTLKKKKGADPMTCATDVCTHDECCLGICTSGHCPRDSGKTLLKSLPSTCEKAICKSSECCADLPKCSSNACNTGMVLNSYAPSFCNSTTCTNDECCKAPGQCDTSTCSTTGYVMRVMTEIPKACEGDLCEEEECCTKRRMIYWIEKTSGKIRRCRYDQCGHDDVKVVKSGMTLPEGIAFDTKRQMLYWCNTDLDKIQRCDPNNCDKSTEDMATNANEPVRLAIDLEAGFLYWSERTSFKVMRCSLKVVPCGRPQVVVRNSVNSGVPYGIAIDSASKMLYWSGSSQVQRCNISDGQSLPCKTENIVGPHASLKGIVGIALDPKKGKVFWSLKNKIEEIAMKPGQTESDIKLVTKNVDMVRGLAIDSVSNTIYMAEGISSGKMSRVRSCDVANDLASCASTKVLISGCPATGCLNMPYDVALDWSEETIRPETRQLPAWATASYGTGGRVNKTVVTAQTNKTVQK